MLSGYDFWNVITTAGDRTKLYTWGTHGGYMGDTWSKHGNTWWTWGNRDRYMGEAWSIHGESIGDTWWIHEGYMMDTCGIHARSMWDTFQCAYDCGRGGAKKILEMLSGSEFWNVIITAGARTKWYIWGKHGQYMWDTC